MGFPDGSAVKSLPVVQVTQVHSLGPEDPLWAQQHTPVFLPGESHGQRSLTGYGPWDLQELDKTEHTRTAGLF